MCRSSTGSLGCGCIGSHNCNRSGAATKDCTLELRSDQRKVFGDDQAPMEGVGSGRDLESPQGEYFPEDDGEEARRRRPRIGMRPSGGGGWPALKDRLSEFCSDGSRNGPSSRCFWCSLAVPQGGLQEGWEGKVVVGPRGQPGALCTGSCIGCCTRRVLARA